MRVARGITISTAYLSCVCACVPSPSLALPVELPPLPPLTPCSIHLPWKRSKSPATWRNWISLRAGEGGTGAGAAGRGSVQGGATAEQHSGLRAAAAHRPAPVLPPPSRLRLLNQVQHALRMQAHVHHALVPHLQVIGGGVGRKAGVRLRCRARRDARLEAAEIHAGECRCRPCLAAAAAAARTWRRRMMLEGAPGGSAMRWLTARLGTNSASRS